MPSRLPRGHRARSEAGSGKVSFAYEEEMETHLLACHPTLGPTVLAPWYLAALASSSQQPPTEA